MKEPEMIPRDEFINDVYCPYCRSRSIKKELLEGPYGEKKAIALGYYYKWYCQCKKCGKEWFGFDYCNYDLPDNEPISDYDRLIDYQYEPNDLLNIRNVQGEIGAHLIKSRLESEGIPAIIGCEPYFYLSLGVFASYSVAVPRKYFDDAKMIIGDFDYELINNIPKRNLWSFIVLMFITFLT